MFLNPSLILATLLPLLSFTSALPSASSSDDLETRQTPDYTWHISKFRSECHSGICSYQFQVDAPRSGRIPAFTATCSAEAVPRGSTALRNCSLNKGNLQGVQGVQAFVELRPVRPKRETRMVIQMGYNAGNGVVEFWRARQTGNYRTFTVDLPSSGEFDVVPFRWAAVA